MVGLDGSETDRLTGSWRGAIVGWRGSGGPSRRLFHLCPAHVLATLRFVPRPGGNGHAAGTNLRPSSAFLAGWGARARSPRAGLQSSTWWDPGEAGPASELLVCAGRGLSGRQHVLAAADAACGA